MIQENEDFHKLTKVAQNTVIKVADRVVFLLRNENSSRALEKIANDFQEVLTSQEGQDNTMAILDLIGFILKDENTSKIISKLCEQALELVTTKHGNEVLKEFVSSLNRVLELEQINGITDAVIFGINKYLTELTPQQITAGLDHFKSMYASFSNQ